MQKTIHIVHIIPTLRYGGAERMVVNLINHKTVAVRHSIVTLSDDMPLRSELPDDVEIRVVQKKGRLSLRLFGDLEKALRDMKPDIVHTHLSGGDIWGRVAARHVGAKIVSTQHNVVGDLGRIKNHVMKRLREYADAYVACSDATKQSVVAAHDISADTISIIRNGIDIAAFAATKKSRWEMPLQLLMIGRLAQQKGHDIALRALATIPKEQWHLTIVGDGELGPSLARLAKELNIDDRVRFVHAQADVAARLAENDIVLMPSRWEGLGVVAMEAMAAGRLVIASDIDGLRESITQNKTGLLTPVGDHNSVAEKINWAIEHKKESLVLAAAGQEYAKQHFGVDSMVAAYEKVYTRLLRHCEER